jgi:hypothetical protein
MSKDKKEISYSILKAGIASIPLFGGAASKILPLLLKNPIEKRREIWMQEIGEKLRVLEEKDRIKLNELANNEIFIDMVIKISSEALKTSEQEKLDYFKNALLNTAIYENLDFSEINFFIRFITDFTVWHVKILKVFDNPIQWFIQNEIDFPEYATAPLSKILFKAHTAFKGKKELCDLIWSDLYRSGLINTSELNVGLSSNGLKSSRTTEFGKKFLSFIEIQDN